MLVSSTAIHATMSTKSRQQAKESWQVLCRTGSIVFSNDSHVFFPIQSLQQCSNEALFFPPTAHCSSDDSLHSSHRCSCWGHNIGMLCSCPHPANASKLKTIGQSSEATQQQHVHCCLALQQQHCIKQMTTTHT